jgi:hypothetical protein
MVEIVIFLSEGLCSGQMMLLEVSDFQDATLYFQHNHIICCSNRTTLRLNEGTVKTHWKTDINLDVPGKPGLWYVSHCVVNKTEATSGILIWRI